MGFNKKFPPNYKWLGFNNKTQLDKRFTTKQREILLMFYTEEEIIELCDRWFIVIEHNEFGLITYNELLHKRLAQIDDIVSTKIDEIDMENSTERIRLDMNNMWRIFVNAHFTKLLKELQDCGFPKSNIKYKDFLLNKHEQIDLRFAFLENVSFYGMYLSYIRLEGAWIKNTKFNYCVLKSSNFTCVECSNSSLKGSKFEIVNFDCSTCMNNDFSSTIIINSSFKHSNISKSDFNLSLIKFTNFDSADCNGINLKGANLKGVNLKNANIDNAILGSENIVKRNRPPLRLWTSLDGIFTNKHTSSINTDLKSASGFKLSSLFEKRSYEASERKDIFLISKIFIFSKNLIEIISCKIPYIVKQVLMYLMLFLIITHFLYSFSIFLSGKISIPNFIIDFVTFIQIPNVYVKDFATKLNLVSIDGKYNILALLLFNLLILIFNRTHFLYKDMNRSLKKIFWSKSV